MYSLIITARLPTRHIAPRLQIQIIIPTVRTLTRQKVQLCTRVSTCPRPPTKNNKLTSPITTSRRRDNGIALEPPRRRIRRLAPRQRLVARARGLDVEVGGGALALDGAANGESLCGGLGA
jgi:hypothetical protein